MSVLEDKYGVPWTAHARPAWMAVFVVLTLGLGPILLAMYLGVWLGLRRRAWLPLLCFVTFSLIGGLSYLVFEHAILSGIMDALILLSPFLWIGGIFLLRDEIQKDARQHGFERARSTLLTFVFSSLYLNYCLRPVSAAALRTDLLPSA